MIRRTLLTMLLILSASSGCSGTSDGAADSKPADKSFAVASEGSAEPSCSPVDGAAVSMVLDTNDGRQVIMRLNTSLAGAKGSWVVGNPDANGGLLISVCDQDVTRCEQANDGDLLIEKVGSEQIEGELSFTLDTIGVTAHQFILRVTTTEQPRCG